VIRDDDEGNVYDDDDGNEYNTILGMII